ncbi:MAG: 4Fe-4S binding protein [Pirellulaceae bacterium]|jgi:electron transport complex protein RnfB|nr:4Fe-4S binding protein [Pirellulaceae bacterium]
MASPTTSSEKRVPSVIAVINAERCTGCEACREVCPSHCIELVEVARRTGGAHPWCEVDIERCIGCRLCVRLPRKRSDRYELKICPWDAIEMMPVDYLPQAVAQLEGPAEFLAQGRPRLVAAATRLLARRTSASPPADPAT